MFFHSLSALKVAVITIFIATSGTFPVLVPLLREPYILPPTSKVDNAQRKFLNSLMEQDHRFIKRRIDPRLGFRAFSTVQRTIQGYEEMHMRSLEKRAVIRLD